MNISVKFVEKLNVVDVSHQNGDQTLPDTNQLEMSVNRALKHSRKIMSKNNNSDKTYSKFMLDHENSK
jgi:uncharacterized protein YggE